MSDDIILSIPKPRGGYKTVSSSSNLFSSSPSGSAANTSVFLSQELKIDTSPMLTVPAPKTVRIQAAINGTAEFTEMQKLYANRLEKQQKVKPRTEGEVHKTIMSKAMTANTAFAVALEQQALQEQQAKWAAKPQRKVARARQQAEDEERMHLEAERRVQHILSMQQLHNNQMPVQHQYQQQVKYDQQQQQQEEEYHHQQRIQQNPDELLPIVDDESDNNNNNRNQLKMYSTESFGKNTTTTTASSTSNNFIESQQQQHRNHQNNNNTHETENAIDEGDVDTNDNYTLKNLKMTRHPIPLQSWLFASEDLLASELKFFARHHFPVRHLFVRFRSHSGWFNAYNSNAELGDYVIVEADRGLDLGQVFDERKYSFKNPTHLDAGAILRHASPEEIVMYNTDRAKRARSVLLFLQGMQELLMNEIIRSFAATSQHHQNQNQNNTENGSLSDEKTNQLIETQILSNTPHKTRLNKIVLFDVEFQFDLKKVTVYYQPNVTADDDEANEVDLTGLAQLLYQWYNCRVVFHNSAVETESDDQSSVQPRHPSSSSLSCIRGIRPHSHGVPNVPDAEENSENDKENLSKKVGQQFRETYPLLVLQTNRHGQLEYDFNPEGFVDEQIWINLLKIGVFEKQDNVFGSDIVEQAVSATHQKRQLQQQHQHPSSFHSPPIFSPPPPPPRSDFNSTKSAQLPPPRVFANVATTLAGVNGQSFLLRQHPAITTLHYGGGGGGGAPIVASKRRTEILRRTGGGGDILQQDQQQQQNDDDEFYKVPEPTIERDLIKLAKNNFFAEQGLRHYYHPYSKNKT